MFLATGAGAMWVAREYPFGSTRSMGPGYFPVVLGGLLAILGVVIMLRGLRSSQALDAGWSARGLIMLPLAVIAFGVLMEKAGFVPALAVLVLLSAAAGKEFRLKEVALLAVCLVAVSVALFVWGLGLPYALIKIG
jgi:hypothetical protein